MLAQIAAHGTEALHDDAFARKVGGTVAAFGGGLHADIDAVGGVGGRIAAEAGVGGGRDADDVGGFRGDQFHVVDAGAAVFGGDVAAAERFDGAAHGAHQGFGFLRVRVADDNAFAAAQRQAGHRVFIGHAARQAQHVADGVLFGSVGEHAAA